MGVKIHKLVIPAKFTHQILHNNHYTQNRHMSAQSHFESFSSNFYTKDCKNIALRVVKSCVICELNRAPYNQKTYGTSGKESLLCRPGEIIYVDSVHLNRSSTGNKYCVIFVDRLKFESRKHHSSFKNFFEYNGFSENREK